MTVTAFPGFGPDAGLDLGPIPDADAAALVRRFADGTMDALTDAITRVGACAHPIRLHGSTITLDAATGEVLSTYESTSAPLGVTRVACGNRRAHICPACSRVYARDAFEMIRAGVLGGKTVPDTVAGNPLFFVTLTAPSFGHVHRAGATPGMCRRHGRAREQAPGAPVCPRCYDYTTHVVWQWHAPELWRRFTIRLRRLLAAHLGTTAGRLGEVATVQYAKVAEYQTRGAVHFHALIRLDGPRSPEGFAPAPGALHDPSLPALIDRAAADVAVTAPPAFDTDPPRVLRFGAQRDVRLVRPGRRTDDPDAPLTPEQVAGYLAKYVTKSVQDTPQDGPRAHYARLRDETERLARAAAARAYAARRADPTLDLDQPADPYERLGKWVDALGFRGHVATKSRRYSITLGALRRARRRWQTLAEHSRRTGTPLDTADLERRLLADDDDTTLVVGSWAYAGHGWTNHAETALALAAAARAREYAQWRAEQHTPTRPRKDQP